MEKSLDELIVEIKQKLEQKDGHILLHKLKKLIRKHEFEKLSHSNNVNNFEESDNDENIVSMILNTDSVPDSNFEESNADTNKFKDIDNIPSANFDESDTDTNKNNDDTEENESENESDTEENKDWSNNEVHLGMLFPFINDISDNSDENIENEGDEGDERHSKCEEEETDIRDRYKSLVEEMKYSNVDQLTKSIEKCLVTDVNEDTAGNNIYYSTEVEIGNFYFEVICSGYHKDPSHILKVESKKYGLNMTFSSNTHEYVLGTEFETLSNLFYTDINSTQKDDQETFNTVLKSIFNKIFHNIVLNKLF